MLFGIIMRLIGASTAAVIIYTLLGGAAEDAFTVLALVFMTVWPQEWLIDKLGNLHGRRQSHAKTVVRTKRDASGEHYRGAKYDAVC